MDQHSLSFINEGEVPSEGGIILYNVIVGYELGHKFFLILDILFTSFTKSFGLSMQNAHHVSIST